MSLGVLWGDAGPSAGGTTCVRSVDASAEGVGAEAALVVALADAASGVSDGGCTDWTVELAGTFTLTDELVWNTVAPLRLVGPAGTTARIEAATGAEHRLLLVDTFPDVVAVTLERLVLADGDVSLRAIGDDEGGAVLADDLRLIDVELVGNAAVAGGAVSTVDLRAVRTSFVRNEAEFVAGQGGAVLAVGAVELENVTFTGNVAREGGGLFMDLSAGGSLTATFVTFVDGEASDADSGADLHLDAGGGAPSVTLRGVLFAGPAENSNAEACGGGLTFDASGPVLTWTASVATDTSCGASEASVLPASDTVAWLSGTTALPRPGAGSPSIGAVACGDGWPTIDQRGVARPQGDACDAGAVERVVVSPPESEPEPEHAPAPAPAPAQAPAPAPNPVPTSIPAGGGACADGC